MRTKLLTLTPDVTTPCAPLANLSVSAAATQSSHAFTRIRQKRALCLPSAPDQIGKPWNGLLLSGLRKDNGKRNGKVISHQINLALLQHLCGPENDVWIKANIGVVTHYGTNESQPTTPNQKCEKRTPRNEYPSLVYLSQSSHCRKRAERTFYLCVTFLS